MTREQQSTIKDCLAVTFVMMAEERLKKRSLIAHEIHVARIALLRVIVRYEEEKLPPAQRSRLRPTTGGSQ